MAVRRPSLALRLGTRTLGVLLVNGPQASGRRRRVAILGSTGSIGVSTLKVIESLPERLEVFALCAHSRWEGLLQQARRTHPRYIALTDPRAADAMARQALPDGTQLLTDDAVGTMVRHPDVDVVLTAIVGAAGLAGTWLALDAGKTVAVANKETLVMAGPLVLDLARRKGARILPVDSEHSAIFQALHAGQPGEIERIVLTASGGPFRGRTRSELTNVTPAQALKHPTWNMGPKITIDSATLMNKALEMIEARWLFDLKPGQIQVIIHPESIIHSFVEFTDGSILAQLSPPDMCLPIQYALTYPERVSGPAKRLCWEELRSLNFQQPDLETFPALQLGYEVARRGGTCGAVLNAANEAAVGAFLEGNLPFLDIPRVCREVLDSHHYSERPTLSELHTLDRWSRQEVLRWITTMASSPNR
ncbi:MAG: 1-deoxy-D-xylulose-5-phosphate reductoisomerase [Planctomycetes bacterium]|nr:1-deoxy-D-xylulose-5-phosphate reductoisomerase [Planctomycetota bacterium]